MLWRLGPYRLLRLWRHLPNFVKLFWRLSRDPRVPFLPRLLLVPVFAYVLLPIDLVPDFIVGMGQVDDLLVIILGLKTFLKLCPSDVVREHVQRIGAGR